jgi:hypothetical protein
VAAEIVDDDNVLASHGRQQNLLDVRQEACAVDRPIEHAGRIDAVEPQRTNEGERAPVPVWGLADQALAALGSSAIVAFDRRIAARTA